MNLNSNCYLSTRNNKECKFNVDCDNSPKPNQVNNPCPAKFQEILGCSENNDSRACPVLLCNYQKQAEENTSIYNRIFPKKKINIIPDYRGSYKVCQDYRDLNIIDKKPDHKIDLRDNFKEIQNNFNPGKPDKIQYLNNIDIESDLKNLDRNTSLCPPEKYEPPPYKKYVVSHPLILNNPTSQKYKYYQFNDNTKIYCAKNPVIVSRDTSPKRRENLKDESVVGFNYDINNKFCNYELLEQVSNESPFRNYNQPVLKQQSTDMPNNNKLQVGPQRRNHSTEALWNNVSRRKHI